MTLAVMLVQMAVAERDYTTACTLLAAGKDMLAVAERDAALLSQQVGASTHVFLCM